MCRIFILKIVDLKILNSYVVDEGNIVLDPVASVDRTIIDLL